LMVLARSLDCHYGFAAAILVFALALSFIAVFIHVGRILWGRPKHPTLVQPSIASFVVPLFLCIFSLIAGITSFPTFFLDL